MYSRAQSLTGRPRQVRYSSAPHIHGYTSKSVSRQEGLEEKGEAGWKRPGSSHWDHHRLKVGARVALRLRNTHIDHIHPDWNREAPAQARRRRTENRVPLQADECDQGSKASITSPSSRASERVTSSRPRPWTESHSNGCERQTAGEGGSFSCMCLSPLPSLASLPRFPGANQREVLSTGPG